MSELPKAIAIKETINEAKDIKTLVFDKKTEAKPGQFLMVWLPEVDEKPFTFSYIGNKAGITVQKRGGFTSKLHSLQQGDLIGIRGPYGNGFEVNGFKKPVFVSGGCGAASLAPLAETLCSKGIKPTVILGARSKEHHFFVERFKKCSTLKIVTDDGSAGKKGFSTDYLPKTIEETKADMVIACGPEKMMKKVFDNSSQKNIKCQLNLERWMKCGFGLCGHCSIDGFLVCKDGPIFNEKQLSQMKEFSRYAYAKDGEKIPVEKYFKK